MKRNIALLAFLLLSASMWAQQTINPSANQVWWGYFSESDFDIKDAIISKATVKPLMLAMYVPANHQQVGTAVIKAVRVYLSAKNVSTLSNMKIWISKTRPDKVSDADYVQDISTPLTTNANDFELTTPYEINNTGFYIGYYVKSTNPAFIRIAGQASENTLFIGNPEENMTWNDNSSSGKLPFQLLVEGGNFNDDHVTPKNFKPAYVFLGQTVDIPVSLSNQGMSTIENISYTTTVNGNTTEEQTITITPLPYNVERKVPITFPATPTEGASIYTVTITKVNGRPNTSPDKSATGKISTVESIRTWPRHMLLEEFTTEKCVNCPDAAATLSEFLANYPQQASQTSVVCHHAGYYTDWLTVKASSNYEWFYNDGGRTYAPAFMYDRYSWSGLTPVERRKNHAEDLCQVVDQRLAIPSYAGIQMEATLNKKTVTVTVNCQRSWDFSNTPQRITLFLTEDDITAKSQSGASGTFVHQHVLRAVNDTWGSILDWTDNSATYSYTFTVSSSWKTSSLKVIALISSYNDSDANDCVVENAAEVNLGASPTAVTTVSTTDSTPVARYTPDGRQVTTPQRGLSIVKTADGRTRKVISR